VGTATAQRCFSYSADLTDKIFLYRIEFLRRHGKPGGYRLGQRAQGNRRHPWLGQGALKK
jgi:hypothetical protein